MMITGDVRIEDLIREYPQAAGFLVRRGLPCVVCGEPFWGTLAELARQKGLSDDQIADLIDEFNRLYSE